MTYLLDGMGFDQDDDLYEDPELLDGDPWMEEINKYDAILRERPHGYIPADDYWD